MLFGQVNRSYQVNFDDYVNVYSNDATEKLEMHGINLNYGLQYTVPLKNDYFVNAGISFSTAAKTIKPIISSLHTSTLHSIPGIQFPILPTILPEHLFLAR